MDKFREKYALHKKYQLSSSICHQQSINDSTTTSRITATTLSQRDTRNVPQKKNHESKREKHVVVGEEVKTSASSSVTHSTASASFDSGDTKSMNGGAGGDRDTRMLSQNHLITTSRNRALPLTNNAVSHRAYQALGGGSSEEQAETLSSTSVHDKEQRKETTYTKNDEYQAVQNDAPRQTIQKICKQQTLNDNGLINNDQNIKESKSTTLPHISTPMRDKHSSSKEENDTSIPKINPTPPRVAEKHTSVQMVPTEAQLRWAQFHQKKRAIMTRNRIEKLMQSPLSVDDVPGATSSDGDPLQDEIIHSKEEHGQSQSKTTKLKLSRGRRALLRSSERKTEERRQFIKEHGFKMLPDEEESMIDQRQDDFQSSSSSFGHHHRRSSTVDDSLAFDDISDALQVGDTSTLPDDQGPALGEISYKVKEEYHSTMMNGQQQKKKSSRRLTRNARRLKGMKSMALTADEDEERMRRFEEAYTLICSVKKREDNVITSNKRWTRGSNVPVAVSIDGRIYSDLQRSPTMKFMPPSKRYGMEVVGAELNGKKLTDRGASWMMHLPKRERNLINSPFAQHADPSTLVEKFSPNADFGIISPGKKKLMEIVDKMQSKKVHVQQLLRSFDNEENNRHGNISTKSPKSGVVVKSTNSIQLSSNIKREAITSSRNMMRSLGVSVQNMKDRITQTFMTEDEQEDDAGYEHSIHTEESDPVYEQKIQMIAAAQIKSSNSVIDTDNQSDASGGGDALQQERIGSLMMSPTVISKRLNQAITAVRLGQWDKVGYLILANPWLAEMTDVTSDQHLIHFLAYYGGGTVSDTNELHDHAPKKLNADLIKVSSTAICKFDSFGNLPLHRAAEAGNIDMANRLIKVFPGGASVRNNDGQLPLHLAILACANEMVKSPLPLVSNIISCFSSGLTITDNDGNLPLHLAVAYVPGDLGARLLHLLLDEIEKHRSTLRFPQTAQTLKSSDEALSDAYSIFDDDEKSVDEPSILSVKNALGWNPITTALNMAAGFEVLDALLSHPDAESLVHERDENGRSLLHLSMAVENCEPSSIISIVKSFPELITFADENGALPIEIACMRDLPSEVIVAIALLDLPIDLDDDEVVVREGFGGSWWYLNCDCDDNYVHVVCEILGICDDYKQKRALCFLKDKQGNSIMTRATPKCKHELRKTLRFHGRYEFLGKLPSSNNEVKEFDALDFGPENELRDEGRPVIVKYYEDDHVFDRITRILSRIRSNSDRFEDIQFFAADKADGIYDNVIEHCVIIESPLLTLKSIVSSMAKQNYRTDHDRFEAYLEKIQKVFRKIGHSISMLHRQSIIHGNLQLDSCGKFEDGWKLTGLIGCQMNGNPMATAHMDAAVPPEVVTFKGAQRDTPQLLESYPASPALDIWAFGKLLYEVFVGKPLIPRESGKKMEDDKRYLHILGGWSEENLFQVVSNVEDSGNGTLAADLISHCLCKRPELRPKSMEDVLSHPYWSASPTQRRSTVGSARKYNSSTTKRRFYA